MSSPPDLEPTFGLSREGPRLQLSLSGHWALTAGVPATDVVVAELEAGVPVSRLVLQSGELDSWDSSLVTFLYRVLAAAAERGVAVDVSALPEGVRRLLDLANSVRPRVLQATPQDDALTARVGRVALHAWYTAGYALAFLGETVIAFGAFFRRRARFRAIDLTQALETAGVGALGIVGLISFLIGGVLAFVGAVQLQQFGATLYVADLVGIGMTRELGALMTGIVMAGRTGAAFAATLGTMTVNEEIDALETLGLPPVEFLVLPRVLATALMMPVLVVYADLLGLLGGTFVGVTLLHLGTTEYLIQTRDAVGMSHVWVGLAKSVAFGAVVALTGCHYGLRSGRNAASVGQATTKAVVMGIVFVVIVDSLFTVLLYALDL